MDKKFKKGDKIESRKEGIQGFVTQANNIYMCLKLEKPWCNTTEPASLGAVFTEEDGTDKFKLIKTTK